MNTQLSKDSELFAKKNFAEDTGLRKAIHSFLSKLPSALARKFIWETKIIIIGDHPFKIFKINSLEKKKQLIILGKINDLNDKAAIGLVAHLFALVDIGYQKKPKLKGKEWLEIDLCSDEVAKGWGFKDEVEELRKIRPQKIPPYVDYKIPVLENSVPDLKFKNDIDSVFDESLIASFSLENRILYTGRFSLICDIESLRNGAIKNLYIITMAYEQNKEILSSLLVR